MQYILTLDQGTTSSRAILFDSHGSIVAARSQEFPQIFPRPGWVEHDPEEIWASQLTTARAVLEESGLSAGDIAAIGIANQRETTVVWDCATGSPIHNAIVWQDRRTADACDALRLTGRADWLHAKTGLVVDPYFSATKLQWILDNVPGARTRAQRGELSFGTVDSFLLWRLSGGRIHATDITNASRTMLFNIHSLDWDQEILDELRIPHAMLPEVLPSSHVYGQTTRELFGHEIAIAGVAGDQQAATFGHACFSPGMVKNTYGTGCFALMNTGSAPVRSAHHLLTTIGWKIDSQVTYCLEGAVFSAGSAVQFLRDNLKLIATASESERLAASIPDSCGVYVVPAFTGLGAPYWDPYARAAILGLTRGSGSAEIVRAALESAAYQTRDLLDAMAADCGRPVQELRVDGGMAVNNLLMQFQADILGVPVIRPSVIETTALGAAYLAGLAVSCWSGQDEIAALSSEGRRFEPEMDETTRARLYRGWQRAVEQVRGFTGPAADGPAGG